MTADQRNQRVAPGERRTLTRLHETLPSHSYLDHDHYRHELRQLWYSNWLCVGRAEELVAGDYRLVEVGDQSIVLLRDHNDQLQAFHNTCRHRGSVLCEQESGRFGQHIVCPYHAWTYALDGRLVRTPHRLESDDFDAGQLSLYRVGVGQWGGFLFINLDEGGDRGLQAALQDVPGLLANWQLETTRVVHRSRRLIACNWKVFWENFNECYHCPGVHPELCRIVPLYRRGLVRPSDDPAFSEPVAPEEPALASGAATWSLDGTPQAPAFAALTEQELASGQTYGVVLPNWFVVTHVDYARSVYLLPRSAEQVELFVEWLLPHDVDLADVDLPRLVELGEKVVEQDARVCELNQRGLHCRQHRHGVLVPQEYFVREFHQWVMAGTGANADG